MAGNRTSLRESGGITTSTYDAANRLRYNSTVSGRTTYTFDNAGNQVSEKTPSGDITTNTWDADSRLIRVELPTTDLVTYTWGPCTKLGEMRQIERDDGTDVTRLVWDNQNVVQETSDLNVVETEYTYQPQPYGTW